jgi:hypothetical protein
MKNADLEKILTAAKNSMLTGKRAPHCFFAWVQGQGYVNRGDHAETRADYLAQLAHSYCWQPAYKTVDGVEMCLECAKLSEPEPDEENADENN